MMEVLNPVDIRPGFLLLLLWRSNK